MEEGRRRHLGSGLRRRGKQRKRKKKRRLASSRPVNNRQPRPTVDRWTGRKQPRPGPAQFFLVADRMVSTLKQKVPLRNNAVANTCTTFGCRLWNWHWQLQMLTVWMSWNLGLEISTNTNRYSSHPLPLILNVEPTLPYLLVLDCVSLASCSPSFHVSCAVAFLSLSLPPMVSWAALSFLH